MNIIIVGCGKVGQTLAEQLNEEGNNITVIDIDPDSLKSVSTSSDVLSVLGNGATHSVQKEAGISNADLLIAVTSEDEINILCCAAAKKLGTKNTVARVRNPEYSELMSLMQSDMNLSLTINPELAVAKEIYKMLRFPSATKIDMFCRGRVCGQSRFANLRYIS